MQRYDTAIDADSRRSLRRASVLGLAVLLGGGLVACQSAGPSQSGDSTDASASDSTTGDSTASTGVDQTEQSTGSSDGTGSDIADESSGDTTKSNESSGSNSSGDSTATGSSTGSDETSSDDPEVVDDWQDDDALDETPAEKDDGAKACEASDTLSISDNSFEFSEGAKKTRLTFYRSDIFRIWQAPDGKFTEEATKDIIVNLDFDDPKAECTVKDDYLRIKTGDVVVRVYQDPVRFAAYRRDNKTLVFAEAEPISRSGQSTVQTLERGETEQFFGGGMQNGRFTHRDKKIGISNDLNWSDGGNPNPAPFYVSSNGYGVYRNTWSDGSYSFSDPVVSGHEENRFDAFYFFGPTTKGVLRRYTDVTGRPFMPPLWALQLGDADCYNKDGQVTSDVLDVAKGYHDNDLPTGWILPNDGYGCGYTDLPTVVSDLHDQGFYTGLWTENDLDKIAWEVETAGTRAVKTDVAWVGSGYQFALNAVKDAAAGIEDNSEERRFIWTVCAWAGTHRYAVMWTGDESGSWDYIRYHIPTIHGSSFSAQNYTSGDIDGIFGGSAKTYVRDLQWKAMTPVFMTMSGWASSDKQPWRYGEPYTSINRKYLQLKMRLMPYMYSYAALAFHTGVPTVRSLVMNYPSDENTWDDTTKYEFLVGDSFLVAPVYEDAESRSGIYLPEGQWFDYWTGERHDGPTTLDSYPAPLDTLPMFVKRGAIIPMWPQMNHVFEGVKDPLTLDIYPDTLSGFTLYEDDGATRKHETGAFSQQKIVSQEIGDDVHIHLGAAIGDFDGKLEERHYLLEIHQDAAPSGVAVDGTQLMSRASMDELDKSDSGWYFASDDRLGVLHVKLDPLATNAAHEVVVAK